jgi:thioredoxin-dependent peroxiredoxin
MVLRVGDSIPLFSLPDQDGNKFNIKHLVLKKALVIYFYPKDESSGCTRQACAFRDHYQDFIDAGAEVIGISSDNEQSHGNFADHHQLPFVLLSDKDNAVRNLFGVPTDLLGILPGRVTYIINQQGIISYIFNSQLQIDKHISESLRILHSLKSETKV